MFLFEPYSVRKIKQINKACLPIRGLYSSASVAAYCLHAFISSLPCLSAIPSLLVIFNLPSLGLIWARWSLP